MRKQMRITIGIIAFIALYTAIWFVLTTRAEQAADDLLETQEAKGIETLSGTFSKTGFPFYLGVRLQSYTGRTPAGTIITVPTLIMHGGLTSFSHIAVTAPDGVSLMIPAGKQHGEIKVDIMDTRGTIDFNGTGISASDMTFSTVTVADQSDNDGTLSAATIALHVDKPDTPPADHTQPGDHIVMNASMILVPGAQIPALGNNIKRLTIDATVMGKLTSLNEAAVKAWSNDGGTIEVKEASADWGALGIGMSGTMSLDPDLQPLGSFNAKITGFTETLDGLAAMHVVKPSVAALASVGLGLLAKPEGPDNLPTVTVPVTIQNRLVYLSSFKLTKLPTVELY